MVHSDWGDWLVREIDACEPAGLRAWYLGCNGFALKASDGTTLFVDPYLGLGNPPHSTRMIPVPFDPDDVARADAVLATHEHTDHVHGPSQAPILSKTDATYHAPDESLAVVIEEDWSGEYGVPDERFLEVSEGDRFEVGGVTVHVEATNDPDAAHPVSYVLEYEGRRFFHGGDGRPGRPFERVGGRYDLDLAALAFGSAGYIPTKDETALEHTVWYADENEVVEGASQLGAERLLPTHWDMWKGLTADPTALYPHVRSYDRPDALELLEIGDSIAV